MAAKRDRDRATDALAAILCGVGSLHFLATDLMVKSVPGWLPAKREVIYGSGVLEIICGLGLALRKGWAGPLSAATLLVIWTANIQMALDAGSGRLDGIWDNRALMWARVPLQIPMIWVAWRATPRRRRAIPSRR